MGGEREERGGADYLDFEVEVGVGSGREYPVAVRSPAGGARATMRFPFDGAGPGEPPPDGAERAPARGRRCTVSVAAPSPRRRRPVEDFGRALFEALLPGEALRPLRRQPADGPASRARACACACSVLDPALAALPWEFLYDPRRGDYVCLSQRTPLVRYLEAAGARSSPWRSAPPLRDPGHGGQPPGPAGAGRRAGAGADGAGPGRPAGAGPGGAGLAGGADLGRPAGGACWAGPGTSSTSSATGASTPPAGRGTSPWRTRQGETVPPGRHRPGAPAARPRPAAPGGAQRLRGGPRATPRTSSPARRPPWCALGLPAVVAMQYAITDRAAIAVRPHLLPRPGPRPCRWTPPSAPPARR